jgi:hypothetical protein
MMQQGAECRMFRRNAVKNKKFRDELVSIIHEARVEEGCSEGVGTLLYTTTSKVGYQCH